jgi:hypothetical protein
VVGGVTEHPAMQVIAANPVTHEDRLAVVRSGLIAVLLLAVGLLVGWLCVATPLIASFQPHGRPTAIQTAAGILAYGFAIVAPAGFLMFGIARFAATLELASSLRPETVTPRLAKALGPDHLAATNLLLPGGRRIHEMVVGPFGIVVVGDVPPPHVSRHVGNRWELRDRRGRWIPIEAPLDRASRDAERVRGWLSTDDRDFLVRVYAAIVTNDRRVERTPTCAVVTPDAFGAWLEALPVQRGLTATRRQWLVELIQSVADGG